MWEERSDTASIQELAFAFGRARGYAEKHFVDLIGGVTGEIVQQTS